MLDSGASHNLLPLSVMEQLDLHITRPYKDLYSFDSKRVKCLGMIKDMVVGMGQIPINFVMMDVVIADVPTNYRIILFRYRGNSVGGGI